MKVITFSCVAAMNRSVESKVIVPKSQGNDH